MHTVDYHKKINVFVVDDSGPVRERISSILTEIPSVNIIGYADNPLSATALILKSKPDVVIIDIFLAGGSGIQVLKNIRDKKINAKIIMLTNYSQKEYRNKCFEEGADFFFDKSIEFDHVVDVIVNLSTMA